MKNLYNALHFHFPHIPSHLNLTWVPRGKDYYASLTAVAMQVLRD